MTSDAVEQLETLVAMPDGPERSAAMEAAMGDTGELGRLTRKYLLTLEGNPPA